MMSLIASIPSPSESKIPIIGIGYYGLCIAIGVLVAVAIAQRRAIARGVPPTIIADVAVWAVPAGLIGARAYHVITDYSTTYCGVDNGCRYDLFPRALQIYQGGLGIPGGLILGTIVGLIAAKHYGVDRLDGLDLAAPAIPIAQAIGRFGNYFNQELFGGPTSLPWGLEISPEHRPNGYKDVATFHPTFLYEALWNVALCLVVMRIDKSRRLAKGSLFALWFGGYWLGRLWVESIRIDDANRIFGMRVNIFMAFVFIALAALWVVLRGFRSPEETAKALAVEAWTEDSDNSGAPSVEQPVGVGEGGSPIDPAAPPKPSD